MATNKYTKLNIAVNALVGIVIGIVIAVVIKNPEAAMDLTLRDCMRFITSVQYTYPLTLTQQWLHSFYEPCIVPARNMRVVTQSVTCMIYELWLRINLEHVKVVVEYSSIALGAIGMIVPWTHQAVILAVISTVVKTDMVGQVAMLYLGFGIMVKVFTKFYKWITITQEVWKSRYKVKQIPIVNILREAKAQVEENYEELVKLREQQLEQCNKGKRDYYQLAFMNDAGQVLGFGTLITKWMKERYSQVTTDGHHYVLVPAHIAQLWVRCSQLRVEAKRSMTISSSDVRVLACVAPKDAANNKQVDLDYAILDFRVPNLQANMALPSTKLSAELPTRVNVHYGSNGHRVQCATSALGVETAFAKTLGLLGYEIPTVSGDCGMGLYSLHGTVKAPQLVGYHLWSSSSHEWKDGVKRNTGIPVRAVIKALDWQFGLTSKDYRESFYGDEYDPHYSGQESEDDYDDYEEYGNFEALWGDSYSIKRGRHSLYLVDADMQEAEETYYEAIDAFPVDDDDWGREGLAKAEELQPPLAALMLINIDNRKLQIKNNRMLSHLWTHMKNQETALQQRTLERELAKADFEYLNSHKEFCVKLEKVAYKSSSSMTYEKKLAAAKKDLADMTEALEKETAKVLAEQTAETLASRLSKEDMPPKKRQREGLVLSVHKNVPYTINTTLTHWSYGDYGQTAVNGTVETLGKIGDFRKPVKVSEPCKEYVREHIPNYGPPKFGAQVEKRSLAASKTRAKPMNLKAISPKNWERAQKWYADSIKLPKKEHRHALQVFGKIMAAVTDNKEDVACAVIDREILPYVNRKASPGMQFTDITSNADWLDDVTQRKVVVKSAYKVLRTLWKDVKDHTRPDPSSVELYKTFRRHLDRVKLKSEPHSQKKIAEGRYRLYISGSIADHIVGLILFKPLMNMKDWKNRPEKPGMGLSTDDQMDAIEASLKGLLGTDVSGWDIMLVLELEYMAYSKCIDPWYHRTASYLHKSMVLTWLCEDFHAPFVTSQGTISTFNKGQQQRSGRVYTSMGNSRARVLSSIGVQYEAGVNEPRCIVMGDDAGENLKRNFEEAQLIYKKLGLVLKDLPPKQLSGDVIEFCSMSFPSRQWVSADKMLHKFACAPTAEKYFQLKDVLKNTPEALTKLDALYRLAAEAKSPDC